MSDQTQSTISTRLAWMPVAVGIALLALVIGSAYASVPLPFSPVPMTLQTLAVLLVGIWGGARMGAIVLASYLVLGLLGFPVFAAPASASPGLAFLARPSGGYVVAFIPAAYIAGWLYQSARSKLIGALLAMTAGHIIIFAGGVAWLAAVTGASLGTAIALGLVPFLLGTVVKIALGTALAGAIKTPATWRM